MTPVSYAVGLLIGVLILMFYNHVLLQYPFRWWHYGLLWVPIAFMQYAMKWTRHVVGVIAILALFGQVLAWIGIVKLPIFHIF